MEKGWKEREEAMFTDVTVANKSYTKLVLSEKSEMDTIAIQVIRQDCPDFLLHMRTMEIDGELELRYELSGGLRLSYLQHSMYKKDFLELLIHMLLPFKNCSDWFLDYHNFVLDENYIMSDKAGQSIKYIYIPSMDYAMTDEEIKKFFINFILKIDIKDDSGYMVNLIRMLNQPEYTLLLLLEYLQQESKSQVTVPQPQRPQPEPKRSFSENLGLVAEPSNILESVKKRMPSPSVEKEKVEAAPSYASTEFGKSNEEGRLMSSLFGEEEVPSKAKEGKKKKEKPEKPQKTGKGGGFFGLFKGKEEKKARVDNFVQGIVPEREEKGREEREAAYNNSPSPSYPMSRDDDETVAMIQEAVSNESNDELHLRLEKCVGCKCPDFIEIDLRQGFATVGRRNKNGEPQADYNFESALSFISRRQFRVEKSGTAYRIVDLDSANGTSVNGQRLVPNTPYNLERNDTITIAFSRSIVEYRVC
ncbi:MAG: DUF6382 domain-containing protein [bacterium]|nr:DUF6382 domain-containing protein [bacterium]